MRYTKISFFVFLTIAFSKSGYGQHQPFQLINHYNYGVFNPAFLASPKAKKQLFFGSNVGNANLETNYKVLDKNDKETKENTKIKGSYYNAYINYAHKFSEKIGVGLTVFNTGASGTYNGRDKMGNVLRASLSGAYRFQMGDDATFSIGLTAGVLQENIQANTDLKLIRIGAYYENDNYFLGVTLPRPFSKRPQKKPLNAEGHRPPPEKEKNNLLDNSYLSMFQFTYGRFYKLDEAANLKMRLQWYAHPKNYMLQSFEGLVSYDKNLFEGGISLMVSTSLLYKLGVFAGVDLSFLKIPLFKNATLAYSFEHYGHISETISLNNNGFLLKFNL